jgi:hypothetical protein
MQGVRIIKEDLVSTTILLLTRLQRTNPSNYTQAK